MGDSLGKEHSSVSTDEVELTLSCLCAAVETVALSDSGRCSVLQIYTAMHWRFCLEHELDIITRSSLRRVSRARTRKHVSDPRVEATDLERLVASTTNERLRHMLTTQRRQLLDMVTDNSSTNVPTRLQLSRTSEVEAETRYCARGRPQPLRCNILGERYASSSDPLAYRTRHRDATEIFQLMRPRVKTELRLRETRRIEGLNAQRRKDQSSAEDALKAKLDQALDMMSLK